MKGKKSVLLYCDIIHTVEKLDDENAGLLFKHLLRYVNDQEPEAPNLLIEIAFEGIKQTLKRDLKTWENKSEARSKSGRIGNLKRYNPDIYEEYNKGIYSLDEAEELAKDCKGSQNVATVAVNDSVNVNVNVKDKVINNIDKREAEFKNSLQPFLEIYGKDLLNKFYLYWTEKKPNGRKMRFEMEKVFDVQRRLKTWSERDYNNNKNFNNGKQPGKSRIDKFISN